VAEKSDTSSSELGRPSRGLYGSDLMVEVLRELGIRYIALNPGASYRGLHDSLVNFGQSKPPEIILCTHEEIKDIVWGPLLSRMPVYTFRHVKPRWCESRQNSPAHIRCNALILPAGSAPQAPSLAGADGGLHFS
jgi:hypothetical protein